MLNEKIAVIITSYNQGKYIERCIKSIINQTYKNLKIIVIDDGSTDNTLEILKKYTNILTITKPNEGVYSVRNLGISLCKTKYFMFVDSDDYLEPGAIEILYKLLINTNSDFAMGSTYSIATEEKPIIVSDNKYEYIFNNEIKYFITSWNKLFKTTLFSNITYAPLHLAEDEYIIHHILKNTEKFVIAPQKTYNYFINSIGLSTKSLKYYKDAIYSFKDRYKFFKNTKYEKLAYTQYMNYCIKMFCELKTNGLETKDVIKEFSGSYKINKNLKYMAFYLSPNTYYELYNLRRKIWKR